MARWYGNEAFLNQYIMFGDAINDSAKANDAIQRKQDLAASRVARNHALFRLLDELPEEFTREDVKKVLAEKRMAVQPYGTYIKRMEDRDLIMPVENGYRKVFNS